MMCLEKESTKQVNKQANKQADLQELAQGALLDFVNLQELSKERCSVSAIYKKSTLTL